MTYTNTRLCVTNKNKVTAFLQNEWVLTLFEDAIFVNAKNA